MSVFPNGNNPPTGAHRVTQHHPMFGCFYHWKKETRKWRGRRQTFIAGANACRAIKNLTDQYQMAFAFADQYWNIQSAKVYIYAAFVWNSCLGMSVKLIPTAARPTGCRNSRQSQRDDGPLFRLFHNQTDTRFFVKHFSSVFSFFRGRRTWTYASVNDCWTQHQ